jgi:hypothetical protein
VQFESNKDEPGTEPQPYRAYLPTRPRGMRTVARAILRRGVRRTPRSAQSGHAPLSTSAQLTHRGGLPHWKYIRLRIVLLSQWEKRVTRLA